MTDLTTPLVARGLLELGIDEHNEDVLVKKRQLFKQARLVVYHLGVLEHDLDTGEVSINAHTV